METRSVFQKPAWKAIVSLSVPSVICYMVMILYYMADLYFVGWLGDVSLVAAVSLAAPVFSVLMAVGTMIANGGCTVTAQALGQKNQSQARRDSALCVWASLGLGAAFAAGGWLLCDPLLRLLGANADTWEAAKSYVLVIAAGAPVILLNHSLNGVLRGRGEIKAGLAGSMLSTLLNIALDPLFIVVLKWGVGGAAIATVLGNGAAVGYYLLHGARRRDRCAIELHPRYARGWRALGTILALGLPNAISTALSGLADTFSNRLLVPHGTAAVAAMGAAGKALMLVTMVQMSICMGIQPLLAYCYGGRDWARLKEVLRKVALLTTALGTGLTLVLWAVRGPLTGQFLQDPAAALLGQRFLGYLLLTGPFIGLYYLAANFLQATGSAAAASLTSALRQGVLLVPLLYLLNNAWGLAGLALAHPAADAVSAAVTGIWALWYYRRLTGTKPALTEI